MPEGARHVISGNRSGRRGTGSRHPERAVPRLWSRASPQLAGGSTGRISVAPWEDAGLRAAQESAVSRSGTSITT